jgi:hypothetical protein
MWYVCVCTHHTHTQILVTKVGDLFPWIHCAIYAYIHTYIHTQIHTGKNPDGLVAFSLLKRPIRFCAASTGCEYISVIYDGSLFKQCVIKIIHSLSTCMHVHICLVLQFSVSYRVPLCALCDVCLKMSTL